MSDEGRLPLRFSDVNGVEAIIGTAESVECSPGGIAFEIRLNDLGRELVAAGKLPALEGARGAFSVRTATS